MQIRIKHTVHIFLAVILGISAQGIARAANKRFAVIIPSRNNSEWCERNISMLINQDYDNWHAIYINDASTDNTGTKVAELIERYHAEDKIILINNETRQGAMANIYKAVHMCDDDDIIVNYDGDDWFACVDVLKKLNDVYSNENVWITYGSYVLHPLGEQPNWGAGEVPQEIVRSNNYRKTCCCTSHLRTFYAWLFKRISIEDLKVDGAFFAMTCDLAIMFPMLEMAAGRFKYIADVLYVYNMETPNNDYKIDRSLQVRLDEIIRSRPPYQPLKTRVSLYV